MNRTLKLLVLSDIFVLTGFGLVAPIMAIFIKDDLVGGSIFTAGVASTIFLIVRCGLQPIFSHYAKPGHRFSMLVGGTFLIAVVPFIFAFSKHITYIYVAQIIRGIGAGLSYPAWFSLFASNLDKGRQGFEWSVYSSLVGLGTAVSSYLGAILATEIGFQAVFFIMGGFALIGGLILLKLEKKGTIKEESLSDLKYSRHYHHKIKQIHH